MKRVAIEAVIHIGSLRFKRVVTDDARLRIFRVLTGTLIERQQLESAVIIHHLLRTVQLIPM
jgi:hypothetical protein